MGRKKYSADQVERSKKVLYSLINKFALNGTKPMWFPALVRVSQSFWDQLKRKDATVLVVMAMAKAKVIMERFGGATVSPTYAPSIEDPGQFPTLGGK